MRVADHKNGWIVGHKGLIRRSGDRGRSWQRVESMLDNNLDGLHIERRFGWAVGAKGAILEYLR